MLAIFRSIIDRRLDSPKMPTHPVKSQSASTWQSVNSPSTDQVYLRENEHR